MVLTAATAGGQTLPIPPRPPDAAPGVVLMQRVSGLDLAEREAVLVDALTAGNVPGSVRKLARIPIDTVRDGVTVSVEFFAALDYLAVGSDTSGCRVPLSPTAAATVAARADSVLPSPAMVDAIYRAAPLRLRPEPMEPGPAMTTSEAFLAHNRLIEDQLRGLGEAPFPDKLIAGHKKDVVRTVRAPIGEGRVAIYGWHRTLGDPIQPLYTGHSYRWVDYSHGIRLVHRFAWIDGLPGSIDGIPGDSDPTGPPGDGRVAPGSQDSADHGRANSVDSVGLDGRIDGFEQSGAFGEQIVEWNSPVGARVRVQASAPDDWRRGRRSHWILYALPNGNTIEQTSGRRARSHGEWRHEIQHVAAQLRWLRRRAPDRNWLVAFLEADGLSWPAWRRRVADGNGLIRELVREISDRTAMPMDSLTLTGHSGGGSFVFGFIDAGEAIPAAVERIAFLDSNYAYESGSNPRHAEKLRGWLGNDPGNQLLVLAYNDAEALLDGKPFVSREGGTWGRSLAMIRDLSSWRPMTRFENDQFIVHRGSGGRVQIILKTNPNRAILHTVQVERNGFIHAALAGTRLDSRGYTYYGPPVYGEFIEGRDSPEAGERDR